MSDFNFFNPDGPLSLDLDFFVSNHYRNENLQYQETLLRDAGVPDPFQTRDRIETIARNVLAKAEDFASQELPDFLEAIESLRALDTTADAGKSMVKCLLASFALELANRVVALAGIAEERYLGLLMTLKSTELSPFGAQFMRRVSRCYLYGFDPECIVMCRALLDAEFQAEISNDECASTLGPRRSSADGSPAYALVDRIAVARKANRIDEELSNKAHFVRKEANRVIHRKPALDCEPLEVIQATLVIVNGLYESGQKA